MNQVFCSGEPDMARAMVKYYIKESGITRDELAERLHVDPRVLRRWLNGDCKMDVYLMNFILSAIGKKVGGIIVEDDDDPNTKNMPTIYRPVDCRLSLYQGLRYWRMLIKYKIRLMSSPPMGAL